MEEAEEDMVDKALWKEMIVRAINLATL